MFEILFYTVYLFSTNVRPRLLKKKGGFTDILFVENSQPTAEQRSSRHTLKANYVPSRNKLSDLLLVRGTLQVQEQVQQMRDGGLYAIYSTY